MIISTANLRLSLHTVYGVPMSFANPCIIFHIFYPCLYVVFMSYLCLFTKMKSFGSVWKVCGCV